MGQKQESPTLYHWVADKVQAMVLNGTFSPGEKIPSLRALAGTLSVSVNTVREAYMLLESRGVVAARPQAGFFVASPQELPRHPAWTKPAPTDVTVPEIMRQVLADTVNPDIVSLSAATTSPEYLPVSDLQRAFVHSIRYRPVESLTYQFGDITRPLRAHIVKRLLAAGIEAHPDDLIITSGSMESVAMALLTVCRRGDTIAIESPAYFFFFRLVEHLGLRVVEVPTDPVSGMEIDVLEYVFSNHDIRAVLCAPNFNNPTGSVMPDDQKERLVRLASDAGAAVIEDDLYGELYFNGQRPLSLAAFDRDGTVVHCGSVSKILASGLRIGWALGGRWGADIAHLKELVSVSPPAPSVQALTEYLDTGKFDRYLRSFRTKVSDNMYRLAALVREEFPLGTRVTQPTGGLTLWAELPQWVDTLVLYHRARERGISLAVGPMFTLTRDFHQFLRLNAGHLGKAEERAIREVGRLLGDMAKEVPW